MDLRTRSHLQAHLAKLARLKGLRLSTGALSEFDTIFSNAQAVPESRLEEAENALEKLLFKAASSLGRSRIASRNREIRPEDVRAGLRKVCPLWPFC